MRNDPVEDFKLNGYVCKIYHDDDTQAANPRLFDNVAKLVCWHSRYKLGDEKIEHMGEEELRESVEDIVALLPLYLFDHSGITISTAAFSCRFDSGQVGWAYITKDVVENEKLSDKTEEELKEYIRLEVSTYDLFIRGEVYGYVITKDGEEIDSCWSFLGLEVVREETKENVQRCLNIESMMKDK